MPVGNEPIPGVTAPQEVPATSQNPDSMIQSTDPASNTMNPEAPRPTAGMNQEIAPVVPEQLMENVPQERRPLVKKIFNRLKETGSTLIHAPGNVLRSISIFIKDDRWGLGGAALGAVAGGGLVASGAGALGVGVASAGVLAYRRFIEPKFYARANRKVSETYTGQELIEKRDNLLKKHQKLQAFAAGTAIGIIGGALVNANPDIVRRALTTVGGAIGTGLGAAGEALGNVAGGAEDFAGQAGTKIAEEGTQFVGDRFSDLGTGVRYVGDNITGPAANKALEELGNAAQAAGNIKDTVVGPAASNAVNATKQFVGDKVSDLGTGVRAFGDNVTGPAGRTIADTAGNIGGTVRDNAGQFVGDRFSDLGTGVRYVGDNITGPAATNAVEGLKNVAGNIGGKGADFVGDRLGDAGNAVGQGIKDNAGAIAITGAVAGTAGYKIGSFHQREKDEDIIARETVGLGGAGGPSLLRRWWWRFRGRKPQE